MMAATEAVELAESDRALQLMVREYATRELLPRARELDVSGEFPQQAVEEMGKLGFFGLTIPERFGGIAGTGVQIALVLEELSRADAATAMTLMAHLHSTHVIAAEGSDEQGRRWLPQASSGACLAAVGLTEPEAGSDVASMRSTARLDGDGYVLDASKTFITNGGQAGVFVVFARVVDGTVEKNGGITAFVVDGNAPGVSAGPPLKKMGLHSSSTTELHLDGVRVCASDRLGREGAGLRIAYRSLDRARMSTAAQAVGIAEGAFGIALEYSSSRVQSGKVIGRHQAVQLRLADMQIELAAARALLYQSARAIDRGEANGGVIAAQTKVFCTRMASRVTSQTVELLGGYGFMEEYQASRYMRDAKGGEIYDGTNDVNRLLIARQLLKAA